MTIVTKQQRKNALFARDVMWPSVPKHNVIHRLCAWRRELLNHNPACFTMLPPEVVDCKTVACFGGWVAINPYFQGQGVVADAMGAPCMWRKGLIYRSTSNVSLILFGDSQLFTARHSDEYFGSDHDVVTHRLNRLIADSKIRHEQNFRNL